MMASYSNKRKLAALPSSSTVSHSKRRKTLDRRQNKGNASSSRNIGRDRNEVVDSGAVKGKMVDATALAWKTLDQEAFGGLQVIKGVDVVKAGGRTLFKLPAENEKKKKILGEFQPVGEGEEDETGSFEGFGDDDTGLESQDEEGNLTPDEDEVILGHPADFANPLEVLDQHEIDETTANALSKKEEKDHRTQGSDEETEEKKRDRKEKNQKNKKETPKQDQAVTKPLSTPSYKKRNNANEFAVLSEDMDMNYVEPAIANMSAWKSLGLSPPLLDAISQLGFDTPTKIQEKAIPRIMKGQDVIGKAETGSGKTLAFGIPIVESWLSLRQASTPEPTLKQQDREAEELDGTGKIPVALILSPTRELAKQIGNHISRLSQGLETSSALTRAPSVAVVTGGLSIQKQQRQIGKADIIVGTPGRLWEILEGNMDLQTVFRRIRFLVVDEADRLFKAGQFKEAKDIIGALDRTDVEGSDDDDDEATIKASKRQTLVFSATFDEGLQSKLAGRGKLRDRAGGDENGDMEYLMKCLNFRGEPKLVDVNPDVKMTRGLKEGLIECGAMEKDLYLYTVLVLNPNRRTLIFTNSISAVRRLTPLLQNLNLNAYPLHSQMIQKARLRSLERFTALPKASSSGQTGMNSKSSILVATDVAARGLDIDNIDQVIHYHVPRSADTYIHRSGRTARGNKQGVSILLCAPDEVLPTRRLAAKVHSERSGSSSSGSHIHMIQALPIDRKIPSRLKPRLDLSKRLADAVLAKEKASSSEQWMRSAAEDLGVEYTSDLSDEAPLGGSGRGGGRKKKEKQAKEMTKAEFKVLRGKLRDELSKRVNMGVSEKYITGGRVDVGKLLREKEQGMVMGLFLGGEGLGLDF